MSDEELLKKAEEAILAIKTDTASSKLHDVLTYAIACTQLVIARNSLPKTDYRIESARKELQSDNGRGF